MNAEQNREGTSRNVTNVTGTHCPAFSAHATSAHRNPPTSSSSAATASAIRIADSTTPCTSLFARALYREVELCPRAFQPRKETCVWTLLARRPQAMTSPVMMRNSREQSQLD